MLLQDLEKWFTSNCDGEWEHHGGVAIQTTDNPGWFLQFDFYDLEVGVSKEIEANNFRNSDRDFVTFVYDEKKSTLTIACGISNLGRL